MNGQQPYIDRIREFNRFYTVLLGFLNRDYLDSGFSITETRILFEVKQHGQISANRLTEMLQLDKSYVSRLIRGFEQKALITRRPSSDDKRMRVIQLTPKGQREAERLIGITNGKIYELIKPLDPATRGRLCGAMETIIDSLQNIGDPQEKRHENNV